MVPRVLFGCLLLLWLHSPATAQLVERFDKSEKKQKSALIQDFQDQSGRAVILVDFAAELKKPETADEPAPPPAPDTTAKPTPTRPLRFCSTGHVAIDAIIREEAREHDVDPCLVMLVMGAESSFKQQAISHKGAMGLMQLIPATAMRFGVKNIFNPKENIHGGTAYLRWLLNYFNNDVRLALAGYNAGEGAVIKYRYNVPPYDETQKYVKLIWGQYQRILMTPLPAAHTTAAAQAPAVPPTYKILVNFDLLQEGQPTDKPVAVENPSK